MPRRPFCVVALVTACAGAPARGSAADGGTGSGGSSAISLGGSLANAGCGGSGGSELGAAPDPLCGGSLPQVTFSRDVAPLVSCTGEACHQPWTRASLVSQPSTTCCDRRLLVAPGQPSSSHLVQAVMGRSPCVERMPPGSSLSDANVSKIVAWICEGALDD